jgi:hypothetical protein
MCTSESRQLVDVLTGSDRLPPSTYQDPAHFLVCREGFQGNDRVPGTRAPEGSLSYHDLDLRRSTFRENPGKVALPLPHRVCYQMVKKNQNRPRVLLGDGTRSTIKRSVQFRYRRREVVRMMKQLDLNKTKRMRNRVCKMQEERVEDQFSRLPKSQLGWALGCRTR